MPHECLKNGFFSLVERSFDVIDGNRQRHCDLFCDQDMKFFKESPELKLRKRDTRSDPGMNDEAEA